MTDETSEEMKYDSPEDCLLGKFLLPLTEDDATISLVAIKEHLTFCSRCANELEVWWSDYQRGYGAGPSFVSLPRGITGKDEFLTALWLERKSKDEQLEYWDEMWEEKISTDEGLELLRRFLHWQYTILCAIRYKDYPPVILRGHLERLVAACERLERFFGTSLNVFFDLDAAKDPSIQPIQEIIEGWKIVIGVAKPYLSSKIKGSPNEQ